MTQMIKDGFFPLNHNWDSLIQGVCIAGRNPEMGLSVLQDCLKNRGVSPSKVTFSSLIHSFSSIGEMGRAIQVLELMTDGNFRYPICSSICTSVVSGFCKIGKPELGLEFYENAEKVGSLGCLNVVTYTAIVNALCKEGRIEEVCNLVCKMEKEGVVLDGVFYSSWVCGYFRQGFLEEAFRKHKAMVDNGIKPDTVSYTILIDGFSKEGNVEKAIGFLNDMKKDGLEPNLVTYTAIMRGFCRSGKVEEAFAVFKRVGELGIEVDEVTYSTLIDGLCRIGDFDKVFLLLEEMEKNGVRIGTITYNTVINGLCKVGRTAEADEMSYNIRGDKVTYSTLLHGYTLEKNAVGILETKKRVEEAGICMDVSMCNVLIKALFMVKAFEDAYLIFKKMPEMGLLANSVTYCTVIDGYCGVGRIEEALEIFDSYRRIFSITGIACYICIIRGLCENGMLDMSIEVFNELIEKSMVPDTFTCMILIKSIFEERNGAGVLKFLHGIDKLGLEIQGFLCNSSIDFLCKRGCFETAFDVYLMMKRNGFYLTSKSYYSIIKPLIAEGNKLLTQVMLSVYIKDHGMSEALVHKILVNYLIKKGVQQTLPFLDLTKAVGLLGHLPVEVIEGLTKQGRVLDAHKLIAETDGDQLGLDVISYSIMIHELCRSGYLEKALSLCATMIKNGISPNIVTYNSVITGLCQQGCLTDALRLFDSLEKINIKPTIITYGAIIASLSLEGYLKDAKQLLEKMVLKGLTPNTRIYNSLIDGYCKFGSLDEALKVLLVLEKSCFEPDGFTVSAVINGCCRNGDMEAALGFYFEYKRKGVNPDFFGFVYLIRGFCIKGRMEEARSILREMLKIQSFTELINITGSKTETELRSSFLSVLCDQGSIEEALSDLSEVISMVFPRRRGRSMNLKKLNGSEAFGSVPIKSLTSSYMESLDTGNDELQNVDRGLESSDNSTRKSQFFDFNVFYSQIALLCTEGKLDIANTVAKELMLNAER
ncbi:hypothetical protein GIB67_029354 [Kingdonia uniflora]|uniref:Pentatricopeptide repeat-containing protein n=1 Tax=Kingdonia uniflora TaxID=39325 RepID=A0A7J7M516_9MAGN|nr:hypothetical protein GIB67_029354 [Kingdonia uniflora]